MSDETDHPARAMAAAASGDASGETHRGDAANESESSSGENFES